MYGNEVSAFHRKYRSKTFNEYMGNTKMKSQIMRALRSDKRPQVILFTGTSGGGKTTMSRLLSKEYYCLERDPEKGACGECYNCTISDQFIETGDWQSLTNDIQEVDATAQGSKADVDRLMEEMEQASYDGNWRIFILDECHEIPKGAQNRLLKTLEEPPEKVLIILATTDPQKLLSTILTRCQYSFEVSKPTLDDAIPLLTRICKDEGVSYDVKAFNLICTKADYVPRQILVNLDKVMQQTGTVTYTDTVEVLEMVADDIYYEFFAVLLAKHIDIYKYVSLISRIKDTIGVRAFITELIPFTKRGIYIITGSKVMGLDKSEVEMYSRIFGKLSIAELSGLLKTLIELRTTFDAETLLLYLGYSGIRIKEEDAKPVTGVSAFESDLADIQGEKSVARENYGKHSEVTEEDTVKFVEKAKKTLSIDEIASMFDGKIARG